jgi:hypothetical protein
MSRPRPRNRKRGRINQMTPLMLRLGVTVADGRRPGVPGNPAGSMRDATNEGRRRRARARPRSSQYLDLGLWFSPASNTARNYSSPCSHTTQPMRRRHLPRQGAGYCFLLAAEQSHWSIRQTAKRQGGCAVVFSSNIDNPCLDRYTRCRRARGKCSQLQISASWPNKIRNWCS